MDPEKSTTPSTHARFPKDFTSITLSNRRWWTPIVLWRL